MSQSEDGDGPATEEARAPLPDPVRNRVVALAADALGRIPADTLPASLRRVASFAPGRRARLAGSQIAGVLATDADFRGRVTTQVRLAEPDLVAAVEAGVVPEAADPVEVAAVAYLVGAEGWQDLVHPVDEALAQRNERAEQAREQADRLARQLEHSQEDLRTARARNRERVEALKAENSELRHKLAAARDRARAAEETSAAAVERVAASQAATATASGAAEAEVRRLRTRIEELEGELAAVRRSDRTAKDAGTLRARLLLDTLLESAQGLRRELALPPVTGTPADEFGPLGDAGPTAGETPRPTQPLDTVTALRQLLALPRAHLVLDGYNVTKTAWESIPLESQRIRLTRELAPLAARTGAEVTVVFDAAERTERPVVRTPRGVRVLFSDPGTIADDLIRELVSREPVGRPVTVVTSDRAVAADVQRMGHRCVGSATFLELLASG